MVLTSSMSAVAPVPEPPLKSEEHWSDPEEQKARGSFYGASKRLGRKMTQTCAVVWESSQSWTGGKTR